MNAARQRHRPATQLVGDSLHARAPRRWSARTSEHLFIHRNTVRQRLDRIATLIGADWQDSARRLDRHLALRIWRLQDSLPPAL